MRTFFVDLFASGYDMALIVGPFLLAAFVASRFETHAGRVAESPASRGQAVSQISGRAEEIQGERKLRSRFGWRIFAVFVAAWLAFGLAAEFIRDNAHNIIRSAGEMGRTGSAD